jgi:hypothetical protein
MQQAHGALERLGVPPASNPLDVLASLVDQSAAVVAFLREKVAELPDVLTPDGPHPMVRLYGVERDRAARVAREAVSLGLEERRVRLDETIRARMGALFLAALAAPELGLSAEQLEAAPRVAARMIRQGEVDR